MLNEAACPDLSGKSRFAGGIKSLFCLFFILFITADIHPQWVQVQTNGLYGGNIQSLAVINNNLFASSLDFTGHLWGSGLVFRSTNNGKSWAEVNNGLPKQLYDTTHYELISTFAVIGSNLFAATTGSGVFLSIDNGASWNAVNNGLPKQPLNPDFYYGITSFAVIGTNLFAGTNVGVFLSTNKGTSWTKVSTGLTSVHVQTLAVNDTNLFTGTDAGVFLSTNRGTSWTKINISYSYSLLVSGTNLYAGTNDGVFVSTNNGAGWTKTSLSNISSLAVIGNNLFAGTWNGIYLSTNNGDSWEEANNGLFNTTIKCFTVIDTNLFAGTDAGVFLSTNNGTKWTKVSTGIPINAGTLIVSPNGAGSTNIFTGTDGSGIYRSTDNGTSWIEVNTGLKYPDVHSFAVSGSKLFAVASNWSESGVYLSTNNGNSWKDVSTGLPDTGIGTIAVCGNNLFAGTWDDGVYLSTNDGTSWRPINNGLPKWRGTSFYDAITTLAVSDTNIFAGTYENGVFCSNYNGTNWTDLSNGLPKSGDLGEATVEALAVSGNNIFAIINYSGKWFGMDIFLSKDNGKSWIETTNGLNAGVSALVFSGTDLFLGTVAGVFLSTNYGTNWTEINSGLMNTYIFSLAVSGTFLFAATQDGLWKRPLSDMITDVKNTTEFPKDFALSQNYPNPFNPSTTISWQSPVSSRQTLKIFDVLGREVATLIDEEKPAGTYEVTWNAANLPSGVYLYRLKVGNYTSTKKLLLLK